MMQKAIASVFRDGMVRIDFSCPEGALPLCFGKLSNVTDAVERHCNLCYDGKSYKLAGLALETDDDRALDMVREVSRRMIEELAREAVATAEA
jgi:hypothetical protein